MIGKTLLIMLMATNFTFAATPQDVIKDIDSKIISLNKQNEIKSLYGEIKFSNLNLILNNKLVLNDSANIKTYFYWLKQSDSEKFDIEVLGELSNEVKTHIKETLLAKLKILIGQDFTTYLSSDELTFDGDLIKALDIAGNESNEKLIDYKENHLKIIEKKPSGTITTDYKFEKNGNGMIPSEVTQKAFEGIQATESVSRISYQNVEEFPLVVKIETNLSQKLFRTEGDDLEVTRELAEIIEFSSIEANSDKALLWFSRK